MSLDLRAHFSTFREAAPARIHLAAHSHHYWPDAACAAQARVIADTARLADDKWALDLRRADPARAARHCAASSHLPDPATIAFAPEHPRASSCRLLSALPHRPAGARAHHRQRVSLLRRARSRGSRRTASSRSSASRPSRSRRFPARFAAAAARGGHDLVFVSQVFFNSAATCRRSRGARSPPSPNDDSLLVIDGYHGFMALPTDLSGTRARTFYLAGGYKYAMAGEGACFMHCPPGYAPRPRDTGWFAAFGALTGAQRRRRLWRRRLALPGRDLRSERALPPRRRVRLDRRDRPHGRGDPRARARSAGSFSSRAVARRRALAQARLVTPMRTRRARALPDLRDAGRRAIHDRLAAAGIVTDVRGEPHPLRLRLLSRRPTRSRRRLRRSRGRSPERSACHQLTSRNDAGTLGLPRASRPGRPRGRRRFTRRGGC